MQGSDRPWYRHIIRTGIRILLGSKRAHYQDRLPGLSIRFDASRKSPPRLFYKGCFVAELCSIETLRQQASGVIHIVGSGPSIRQMDMALLPARSTILLNGAISLLGDKVTVPLAVAIEDERFIYRHFDGIMGRLPAGTICLFSVSVLRAICEKKSQWLADKKIILIDNILKPYGGARLSIDEVADRDHVVLNDDGTVGISLQPDLGVFQAGSVAVSALQFALACDVDTIGFIGIDISNAAQPRFYEKSEQVAFSGVADAEERILRHVRLALTVAQGKNIQLLNFSPVSALAKLDLTYDPRLTLGVDDGV